MMKFLKSFCFIVLFLPFAMSAQSEIDTATSMVWTGASFAYQLPGGHLKETFKGNFNLGTWITYKTSSNWTLSVNFNYMFGSKFRSYEPENLRKYFGDIITTFNYIVDGEGKPSDVFCEGRYWNVGGSLGKVIPIGPWKNSGIWVSLGAGYISHKIHITTPDNRFPQLSEEYRKGYDRRSGGFYTTQFVGYLFMRKRRVASFFAGIELYEMWTKPSRTYIFTEGPTDEMKNKFSILTGFKIGWIVPLYEKKKTIKYYTY